MPKLTPAELEAVARALAQYVADHDSTRDPLPSDTYESALSKINAARPSNLSKRLTRAIRASTNVAEEN